MPPDMPPYEYVADHGPHSVNEQDIGTDFIERLRTLKHTYRDDIHDRTTLEKDFRDRFEPLNHVTLTDGDGVPVAPVGLETLGVHLRRAMEQMEDLIPLLNKRAAGRDV